MSIAEFNHLASETRQELLTTCCGSSFWVHKMLRCFPVEDLGELLEYAEEKWCECSHTDWLEAFTHHPKIGDLSSLQKKFASTAAWAANEQATIAASDKETLIALVEGNAAYEKKFGYIFIVCATGKAASEMLELLLVRLQNTAADEIEIAAAEQNKITKLRLQKLLSK